MRATDGSGGGSDDEEGLGGYNTDNNNDKDDKNVEEGEGGRGDNNDDNGNNRGEYGGEQGINYEGNIDPANLFGAASKSVAACENILHGYLYVFDLAFVILKGIYGFKFSKRFLELSSRDLTSFLLQLI